MYYVSIDPSGKLAWEYNVVDYGGVNSHVIEVITSVSGPPTGVSSAAAASPTSSPGRRPWTRLWRWEKLNSVLGMQRVMIGGGGVLNWSFLHAGLVDEISLVVSPFADGDTTKPGLFSAVEPMSRPQPRSVTLIEARELRDSVLLVRYRVDCSAPSSHSQA